MRNIREGYLTDEWKNFKFKGYGVMCEIEMKKEEFEYKWGKFLYAVYPDKQRERPYALWTEEHVVIILDKDDKLGIASITRNPSKFSFG